MNKRIPEKLLRPGYRLPGALRNTHGHVLLPAGTCLTEVQFARLRTQILRGVFGGDDWPDDADADADPHASATEQAPDTGSDETPIVDRASQADNGRTQTPSGAAPMTDSQGRVSTTSLRSGMRLTQDICDVNGLLLLAAGTVITPRFLDLLQQRQIQFVRLGTKAVPAAAEMLHTVYSRQLDEMLDQHLSTLALPPSPDQQPKAQLRLSDMLGEAQRAMEKHSCASGRLQDAAHSLNCGRKLPGTEMRGLVRDFADLVTLDGDLLPTIMTMQRPKDEYLFDHSVNGSLLSMAIAAYLGLEREHIVEIGFGALVQDLGMLRIPDSVRLAPRSLSSLERVDVECHPIHTLDYLEGIEGMSNAAKFIGYQVHERYDRTGYPRQRSGLFIHHYARIVAIADAFAAMTRPRPYRPPKLPYDAAKAILLDAGRGRLDRDLVRAFLDCVSLFPIGSWVRLSDGAIARVVRANPGVHTKPIVVVADSCGELTGDAIDLSRERDILIVGTLGNAEALRELARTTADAEADAAPTF